VVNIVTGFGREAGAPIVNHPEINKIAFTGSASVGKIILRAAAGKHQSASLWNSAAIPQHIFCRRGFRERHRRGGSSASSSTREKSVPPGSRILVEKKIYSKFVDAMVEKAKRIKLGPPLDRDTKMGPLVSKNNMTASCSIRRSEEGAKVGAVAPRQSIRQGILRRAHYLL